MEDTGSWYGEKPAIPAIALIRRESDGVIRPYENDYYGEFIWSEGNYSCDCNRAIFFANTDEDDECECGDTRYTVRIIAKDGSGVLYDEWE